jgi:RNA polymerase sigma-70 factor (ECF subfamily)
MHHVVESVFRDEHAKVFAALVRHFGDFQLAEDALQEAFVAALATWAERGVPERPAAWITTVARNCGTSVRRREALARDKYAHLEIPVAPVLDGDEVPDERLALMFTCCHPALAEEVRVALTLKTMCGLPTAAIARLFLVSEAAIFQRLLRAKKKIAASKIPFAIPRGDELDERIEAVLAVIYLLFTEGYATTDGEVVMRSELCEEAIRLGALMTRLMPADAEARGLHALMLLHHARRDARVDVHGEMVALEDQDPRLWDRAMLERGLRELDEALARGRPGPYQVQAAIAALHATNRDWTEIAALYAELCRMQPSLTVEVSHAVAVGMAHDPEGGLALLARLPDEPLVLAARADLLCRAGRPEALDAYARAIGVARNERERRFLLRRQALAAKLERG